MNLKNSRYGNLPALSHCCCHHDSLRGYQGVYLTYVRAETFSELTIVNELFATRAILAYAEY